jgi:hypothetical protein
LRSDGNCTHTLDDADDQTAIDGSRQGAETSDDDDGECTQLPSGSRGRRNGKRESDKHSADRRCCS